MGFLFIRLVDQVRAKNKMTRCLTEVLIGKILKLISIIESIKRPTHLIINEYKF